MQGTVPNTFKLFDLNGDGIVTLDEIGRANPITPAGDTNLPAVQDTVKLILAEMALGAGGEQVLKLPGVKLSDLPHRLCSSDGENNDGEDSPKVCPIFPEPPGSSSNSPEDKP
jgi:hypothetical protein